MLQLNRFIKETDYRCQMQKILPLVKRETGANPVRTRHCEQGVGSQYATERLGRRLSMLICESGDLPVREQGEMPLGHE